MMEISFTEGTSQFNEHWPVHVNLRRNQITISHDVQRDRDSVTLTLEEWRWITEKIAAWLSTEDRMLRVTSEVDSLDAHNPDKKFLTELADGNWFPIDLNAHDTALRILARDVLLLWNRMPKVEG